MEFTLGMMDANKHWGKNVINAGREIDCYERK